MPKQWGTLILLIILIIIFEPFIKVSLTLSVVVAAGFTLRPKWALIMAVILGLVVDIRAVSWLGVTSLYYIVLVGIVALMRERFEQRQVLLVGLTSIVTAVLWHGWVAPPINLWIVMVQAFVTMVIWRILVRGKNEEGVYLK